MSFIFNACKKEIINDTSPSVFSTTPLLIEKPLGLPPFPYPDFNPITAEGVDLGRHLFYDPALSADSTISCSSCHKIEHAFSDGGKTFSIGIDGLPGKRNAMGIMNLGYVPFYPFVPEAIPFFWDGRAASIEAQALMPIEDVLEMHELLPNLISKLQSRSIYRTLFCFAFGTETISDTLIGKALAQFERTLVSGNAKYDQANNAIAGVYLSEEELDGYTLFNALDGGDCFHCHGINSGLFTDYKFRNNGLDSITRYFNYVDAGRGAFSIDTADYGRFKTPSLRNIELTAPYMHDGRFATLEDVLDFYSEHVKKTNFTDPFMQFANVGGVHLTTTEKEHIILFLKTLTDTTYVSNPAYNNPW